jgi:hypothetical protein
MTILSEKSAEEYKKQVRNQIQHGEKRESREPLFNKIMMILDGNEPATY